VPKRRLPLLSALAFSSVLPHGSAGERSASLDPTRLLRGPAIARSRVLVPDPAIRSGRTFRADFAPSSTLLLAYSSYWEPALDALIAASASEADVLIVVPEDERASAEAWIEATGFSNGARSEPKASEVGSAGSAGPGADDPGPRVLVAALDTPWIRDYGPLQVSDADGGTVWLDAGYSGARPADDRFPPWLGRTLGVRVESVPITLDGGGIIGNGSGLCAVTERTFEDTGLSNFDLDEHDRILRRLGCAALAVVPALAHEPTGHVDMFGQFVAGDRLLLADVDPRRFEDEHVRLEEARRGIEAAARTLGIALEVVRVPMPMPAHDRYLSYVNGVRLGGSFMVPSYEAVDPEIEHRAHRILSASMEDVRVVPIPADRMIELEGAIHCVTQGLSAGRPKPDHPTSLASRSFVPPM
jgi:agmatine/peptidylarginine deiminase